MRTAANEGMHSAAWPTVGSRQGLLRDMGVVLLVTALTGLLCIVFNINEALFHWTRRFEGLQFDELPLVLLTVALGFGWFAMRRYREAGALLVQQRAIDERLSAALADNRRLAQQYLSAQESERRNLARELHDELGQYLNAIKIDAVSIRDYSPQDRIDIRDTAVAIARNADHVYSVVTELIRKLRPVGLDDLGLLAAIEHCIDQWRRLLPNTHISMSAQGDMSGLSEHANLTAYRLTQESLTNVAKHARAKHIAIELARTSSVTGGGNIAIRIADDGVGADLSEARSETKTGFGLVSMRERIEMQGGRLNVQSAPAQGFVLNAYFPA